MAAASSAKTSGKQAAIMIAAAAVLAAGAGITVAIFHAHIARAQTELDRLKEEYPRMVDMREKIESLRQKVPKPSGSLPERTDDLLEYLERKAVQAGLPRAALTIGKDQDRKSSGWKEMSFSVQLRGASKESPIPRAAVVEFLKLVETERPSVKSKNANLMFAGDNFNSVLLTFSCFQREP